MLRRTLPGAGVGFGFVERSQEGAYFLFGEGHDVTLLRAGALDLVEDVGINKVIIEQEGPEGGESGVVVVDCFG